MMEKGWDFRRTAAEVEAILADVKISPLKPQRSTVQKRASLQRMWETSNPIKRGDPASLWLKNRVGNILFPSCLRYTEKMVYAGDPPTYHHGMIARVDGPDGSPQTIHRTYITQDGQKADVEEVRRLMPGTVEPGSAVRLFEPKGGILAVAEGIETALAVLKITALPCWATINTTNMQAFTPPKDVEELYIFGDNDAKFAGQAAAYTLAKKFASKIRVHVILPEKVGMDWNDVLNARYARVRGEDNDSKPRGGPTA
jgi:putative DNA primase/helicase